MTTDQLFKHLEKTGDYICVYYSPEHRLYFAYSEEDHLKGDYFEGKTPEEALNKLYDYAQKEGLVKSERFIYKCSLDEQQCVETCHDNMDLIRNCIHAKKEILSKP